MQLRTIIDELAQDLKVLNRVIKSLEPLVPRDARKVSLTLGANKPKGVVIAFPSHNR